MKSGSIALAIALVTLSARAHAEDNADVVAPPLTDATAVPAAPSFHRLHATLDAFGLFDGRYTVAVEALTQDNESFVLSGFYLQSQIAAPSSFSLDGAGGPKYSTATQAFGTELAYRRYLVRPDADSALIARAATGLFLSPGVGLSHFTTVTTTSQTGGVTQDYGKQSWLYVGPSLDLGGQLTSTTGFVVAGSIGAHWRAPASHIDEGHYPWTWEASNGSGPRPRFRLEIGWAFL